MVRLVAVDLDGTLLRSDGTVSARTVAALDRARNAGARVVVVTARPPRYLSALAAATGLGGLAVCSNGAVVYDMDSDRMDVVGELPIALAERTAATLATVLPGAAFAVETGRRCLIGPGYGHVARRDGDRYPVLAAEQLWTGGDGCVKLLAWSPAPVTVEVLRHLGPLLPDVALTWSGGSGMLEVSAAGVSKVGTLARLCDGWGVRADEVVAFGDMPNDLSVLSWAGTPVAVANAHPDVLALAARVTGSNDEDGVAAVLEEIFGPPTGAPPGGGLDGGTTPEGSVVPRR